MLRKTRLWDRWVRFQITGGLAAVSGSLSWDIAIAWGLGKGSFCPRSLETKF